MNAITLWPRWRALCATVAAPSLLVTGWFDQLLVAWSSGERFYHTLDHLASLLDLLDEAREIRDAPALQLATWFHDAIYDPPADDNEERSAELACLCAVELGLSRPRTREVVRLILLTRTHVAAADDVDGQLLLDADLAILAADPEAYDRYAEAIRREYAWVPEERYQRGRAHVLQSFLKRPAIYQRAAGHWERAARENLRRELERLGVFA